MAEQQEQQNPLAAIVLSQVVVLAIALTGIRWADIVIPVDASRVPINVALGALAGIVSYGVLLLFARVDTTWSRALRNQTASTREKIAHWQFPAIFLAAAIPAFSEELLFRVLIQGWLSEATLPWLGILVAALAFGAAHMISTAYFVLSLLLGLAIGVSYFIANDVVLIVTWHLVYNVISMTVICKYPQLIKIADD